MIVKVFNNEDNTTESSDVNVESESIENSNDSNDEIPQQITMMKKTM